MEEDSMTWGLQVIMWPLLPDPYQLAVNPKSGMKIATTLCLNSMLTLL